jgi:16S rRNA C967 or C1407 C5-methylase (RsmB/RsmF family)
MYATCTYHLEENQAVVQELLEQRPATLPPIALSPHSSGLLQWKDYTYDIRMQHWNILICVWYLCDNIG